MNDFKLKLIVSILSGIVFSFIFILLAFILPTEKREVFHKIPKGKLEQVSHSLQHK